MWSKMLNIQSYMPWYALMKSVVSKTYLYPSHGRFLAQCPILPLWKFQFQLASYFPLKALMFLPPHSPLGHSNNTFFYVKLLKTGMEIPEKRQLYRRLAYQLRLNSVKVQILNT